MRHLLRISAACLIMMIVCVAFGTPADAQQYTSIRPGGRGVTWDFYLPLSFTESETISGEGGSSVKLNADWGFGFGLGYNLTDHFQLNGLWTFSSRSYDATTSTGVRYSNWLETSTLSVNGIYYLLKGNFTPFVSGGVGITYMDTNIQDGPGSGFCWWDPWWGYVCGTYVPTKTENDVTYNAGLGVRFDADRSFSLQASYNKTWIDISNATGGAPDFAVWRLDFLFRF